jgi:hypothetical protein
MTLITRPSPDGLVQFRKNFDFAPPPDDSDGPAPQGSRDIAWEAKTVSKFTLNAFKYLSTATIGSLEKCCWNCSCLLKFPYVDCFGGAIFIILKLGGEHQGTLA